VLAEIDPEPYRDQVSIARSKLETAQAELHRQEAAVARLRLEVPIQIAIAARSLAASVADQARARDALKLTGDEVEKGIEEAQAGLEAAKADLVLAQQQLTAATKTLLWSPEGASIGQRRLWGKNHFCKRHYRTGLAATAIINYSTPSASKGEFGFPFASSRLMEAGIGEALSPSGGPNKC
jgi:hypothetical protein